MAENASSWRSHERSPGWQPVDAVVTDYAAMVGRPWRRRKHSLPGRDRGYVTWAIDGEVVVEFLLSRTGPARLLVHEIGLLAPLKKELRTRHVTVEYAPLD